MMTELMLVEGVSDVQLISYYLQNVYGWRHEKNNNLGIHSLDEHEISSIMVVTDRDEDSIPKIGRTINSLFENVSYRAGEWKCNNRCIERYSGRCNEIFWNFYF